MKNNKKTESFTHYEKRCPDHKQDATKRCYCDAHTESVTCNRMNCPEFAEEEDEQ